MCVSHLDERFIWHSFANDHYMLRGKTALAFTFPDPEIYQDTMLLVHTYCFRIRR